MHRGILAAVSLAALGAPAAAHAEGFGEVVAGMAIPLGDDDYDNAVDESFKLGVRGGSRTERGLGLEIGLDWTAINDDVGGAIPGASFDVSWNRLRLLAGARVGTQIGGDRPVIVFGRAGAGLDLVHTNVTTEVLGVTNEDSETDAGLALEVGGGVIVSLGQVAVGFQVAVPMGFHFEDDTGDDTIVHDYSAYDLDLLGTVATSF